MGIDDSSSNYRVIGTYPQADSFSITKAAGNQANAISFVNPDGAQVFYSKEFPANVYLAFPDVNYQIEIFDPFLIIILKEYMVHFRGCHAIIR